MTTWHRMQSEQSINGWPGTITNDIFDCQAGTYVSWKGDGNCAVFKKKYVWNNFAMTNSLQSVWNFWISYWLYGILLSMIFFCTELFYSAINFPPTVEVWEWIDNFIPHFVVHYKVWDDFTYPFANFNGATVEVWEWISNFIPHCIQIIIIIIIIIYWWWDQS